jgi:hypothetical protein
MEKKRQKREKKVARSYNTLVVALRRKVGVMITHPW